MSSKAIVRMERLSFATKILISYSLAALLLIGSLTIFGLYQARQQDEVEIAYTTRAVDSAIKSRAANFRGWLKGYALWDDIYIHMALSNDTKWADENLGPGVWKTFTMPMKGVFISDDANNVRYHYWDGPGAPSLDDFRDADLKALRGQADQSDNPVVKSTIYEGEPVFIGVARLRPMNPKLSVEQNPKRYLVWLQPISGRVLTDIGQSMAITALRWEPRFDAPGMPALDLFPGAPVKGRITWTPRRPGTDMLQQAWLPGLLLLLFTGLVGLGQYVLASRLNFLLAQRQTEAETETEKSRRAAEQAAAAERDAQALMLRLTEQEKRLEKLSAEREAERVQRKEQARAQSLATLSLFEQDFDTVLQPISGIAERLKTRSGELEREAEAGRKSAKIVLEASHLSTEAIDAVVRGNTSLSQATARLDDNVSKAVASTREAEQELDDLIRRLADLSANAIAAEEVVATVTDVATRINMLALNARIEAARAGEHGHGFAVVAEEVRQMAEVARKSAETIASVLQIMHDNTQTATMGIDVVGGIVGKIADVTASSRNALDHHSDITGQIMDAIAGAKARVSDTETAMHELDQALGSSERMAKALSVMAGELNERSWQLQTSAGQFADVLRNEGHA